MKKCYGCGDNFAEKFSSATTQHRGQARRPSAGTQGRWCSAQTLPIPITMHPRPVHIMRKNPVYDERVHIDFSTYHSLDESQKEMLKEYGLIVIISLINSNATRVGLFYLPQYSLLFFIATKK